MKASSLLFRKRISILGIVLFLIVGSINLLIYLVKNSIKILINCLKWLKNYINFRKSGYSHAELYSIINSLTGREFEKLIYYIFKELGYKITLTSESCDGGKDLIIENEEGLTYIECKRWSSKDFKVGRPEVQKLVGASVADNVNNMLFITTSNYTNEAKEYAKKFDNLELWDMQDLMLQILKLNLKCIPKILCKTLNNSNVKVLRLKPC